MILPVKTFQNVKKCTFFSKAICEMKKTVTNFLQKPAHQLRIMLEYRLALQVSTLHIIKIKFRLTVNDSITQFLKHLYESQFSSFLKKTNQFPAKCQSFHPKKAFQCKNYPNLIYRYQFQISWHHSTKYWNFYFKIGDFLFMG